MKWFAGIFLFLPMLSCVLAADDGCTNAVPAVVWSSRSGLGLFKEVRRASYESAGWLKWLGEKHKLRCDIFIEGGRTVCFCHRRAMQHAIDAYELSQRVVESTYERRA